MSPADPKQEVSTGLKIGGATRVAAVIGDPVRRGCADGSGVAAGAGGCGGGSEGGGVITKPGIYSDIGEADYHCDPCPDPSLSHSIAKLLLQRSPLHAHASHPRLGGNTGYDSNTAMDDGSIIHKLMLGRGADIVEVDAPDWRTNAAKAARDAAWEAGKLPVLAGRMEGLMTCAKAALDQIKAHPDLAAFSAPGIAEAVLAWREGATWCRAMVDYLPDDPSLPVFDIKTTALAAAPESWERRLVHEYATQAAFYRRGLKALGRKKPGPLLFVVIEVKPPYGLSVMTPAPSLLAYAEAEVERALETWTECMADDVWPGYPAFTAHVELPGYLAMKAEERAINREFIAREAERLGIDDEFMKEMTT